MSAAEPLERFGHVSLKQSFDFVASVACFDLIFDDCSKQYHWLVNLAKKLGFALHFELTNFDLDQRGFSMGFVN